MSKPIQKAILFRTTVATDVMSSGGVISVAGLSSVRRDNLLSIKQIKYRPEVVQVVTASTTAAPTGSTTYGVLIGDPNRFVAGAQSKLVKYTYTTPTTITDLGATAALQREAINVAIIAKINADTANYVSAVTLGTGTGFTITDDAGYYPVYSQTMNNRKGASTVLVYNDGSGAGFASSVISVTTNAVYSFGVGADVAAGKPVIDIMYGNLISGTLVAPPLTIGGLPGVSGQNYDAYVITSLSEVSAHSQTGQLALVPTTQTIWVDNGTGSDTTNAAGAIAFQRKMFKFIFSLYKNDPSALYTLSDTGMTYATLTGLSVIPTTALAENTVNFGDGQSASFTPTIVATAAGDAMPLQDVTSATVFGINLANDAANGKGMEISAPLAANSGKSAIVGKTGFSYYARVYVDDVSGVDPGVIGLRKKEAYAAAIGSYTDYACIGLVGAAGDIKTQTRLNSGAVTTTDTTLNWTDATSRELEVRVDIDGVVKWYVDGTQVNSSTSFTFDAGDEIIFFNNELQTADVAAQFLIQESAFLPTNAWRS